MSTFATAVVIDVPADGAPTVAEALASKASEHASVFPTEMTDVYLRPLPEAERVRITAYLPFQVGLIEEIGELIAAAGNARAVIAEDNDEFGACWAVLASDRGSTRIVHRRYILNADPSDPDDVALALTDFSVEGDPRALDVAGTEAARAAALLFGVDAEPVADAERRSANAWEGLGSVGGPFPWWDAMGLIWPGPEAGSPLKTGER